MSCIAYQLNRRIRPTVGPWDLFGAKLDPIATEGMCVIAYALYRSKGYESHLSRVSGGIVTNQRERLA